MSSTQAIKSPMTLLGVGLIRLLSKDLRIPGFTLRTAEEFFLEVFFKLGFNEVATLKKKKLSEFRQPVGCIRASVVVTDFSPFQF